MGKAQVLERNRARTVRVLYPATGKMLGRVYDPDSLDEASSLAANKPGI